MAKKELKKIQKPMKPKEYQVVFVTDFEGSINNNYVSAKAGDKKKVNKLVYDFVKKHGVVE